MKKLISGCLFLCFCVGGFTQMGCEKVANLSQFVITEEDAFVLDQFNTEGLLDWKVNGTEHDGEYKDKLNFHNIKESQIKTVKSKSVEIEMKDGASLHFLDSMVVFLAAPGKEDVLIGSLTGVPKDVGFLVMNVNEVPDLHDHFKTNRIQFKMEGFSDNEAVQDSINMRIFFTVTVDHKAI